MYGWAVSFGIRISGSENEFQPSMNASVPTTRIPGTASGRSTRRIVSSAPAPSIRAACSSRTGICRNVPAMSQMPSGVDPAA